jgi:hypothetical protein
VARGAEEVDGTPGRRGIHHDQVITTLLVELVELLDRHVLLGSRQRVAEILIEPAPQDCLSLGIIAGVMGDRGIEGRLRVQHQDPQLPGPCSVDSAWGVGERVQSKRVGQSSGRVNGDNAGAQTLASALDGQGGRSGGLADSS